MNTHKLNKKYFLFLLSLTFLTVFLFFSYSNHEYEDISQTNDIKSNVRIGFSQTDCSNPWRTIQLTSFKESAKMHGYELIYYEPEEDSIEWQQENLRLLLENDLDYLVISPKDISALKEILLEAEKMGTSIIFIDTDKVTDKDIRYLTRISSNYAIEGQLCADALGEYFKNTPAKIIEITGDTDLEYTQVRSLAFALQLKKYPDLSVAAVINGDFDSDTAAKALEKIVADKEISFDAIFAHSDEAGIGALQALKVAGKDISNIPIVSINGSQDALKAIIAKEYLATITSSPNIGTVVMSAIEQHENGYRAPEWILIPNKKYDAANALENYNYAY